MDVFDGIVAATSNRADGKAVATRASSTSECNVLFIISASIIISLHRFKHTVPLLIARQSSWFCTLALEMMTPWLSPTSNASVL